MWFLVWDLNWIELNRVSLSLSQLSPPCSTRVAGPALPDTHRQTKKPNRERKRRENKKSLLLFFFFRFPIYQIVRVIGLSPLVKKPLALVVSSTPPLKLRAAEEPFNRLNNQISWGLSGVNSRLWSPSRTALNDRGLFLSFFFLTFDSILKGAQQSCCWPCEVIWKLWLHQ